MVEQKVIFDCNHTINILKRKASLFRVRRSDIDIDKVGAPGAISSIFYLYQIKDDGSVLLYNSGKDYTTMQNEITWISDNRPEENTEYIVEAFYTSRYIADYTSNPNGCERCFGNGWYVENMATTYKRMEYTKGIRKMVQNYIKILYTRQSDDGYGTNIHNLVGAAVYDKDAYLSDVLFELNSAAIQLQQIQANLIAENAEGVTDDEMLEQMRIDSSDIEEEEGVAYIKISLISVAPNEAATLNFRF